MANLHYCHCCDVAVVDKDGVAAGHLAVKWCRCAMDLDGTIIAATDQKGVPVPAQDTDGSVVSSDNVVQEAIVTHHTQTPIHLSHHYPAVQERERDGVESHVIAISSASHGKINNSDSSSPYNN